MSSRTTSAPTLSGFSPKGGRFLPVGGVEQASVAGLNSYLSNLLRNAFTGIGFNRTALKH